MLNNPSFAISHHILQQLRSQRGVFPKIWCSHRYYSSHIDEARDKLKSFGEGHVHLSLEDDVGIAKIRLDHKQKRNALSGSMMVQLEDAVCKLEKWENGKAVIIEGAGDAFCSGGDLSVLKNDKSFGFLMTNFMQNVLLRLRCLPMVSVALVHGKAIGGGAELSASTDYRVFSPKGEVHFVQAVMGVTPGWGGTTWLNLALGHKKALDILLSCQKLSASEALKMGYADAIAPEEGQREAFARQWILKKVSHHHEVVRAVKQAVIGAQRTPMEQSLMNEQLSFLKVWGGPANLEAFSRKTKHR